MANPKKLNLGVFAAGELPFPVAHQFLVSDEPIDLTAFTAFVNIEGPDETVTLGQGTVSIDDAANGLVSYTWTEEDFRGVGKYRMLIWVESVANRFASDLIVYEVYDGPGPTPE